MTEIQEQLNRIERNTLLGSKRVLVMDDVALLTGLSKSHLYKLTCSHRIPYYKPNGKQIYFDKEEIQNWMLQNKVASNDEIQERADNYLAGL